MSNRSDIKVHCFLKIGGEGQHSKRQMALCKTIHWLLWAMSYNKRSHQLLLIELSSCQNKRTTTGSVLIYHTCSIATPVTESESYCEVRYKHQMTDINQIVTVGQEEPVSTRAITANQLVEAQSDALLEAALRTAVHKTQHSAERKREVQMRTSAALQPPAQQGTISNLPDLIIIKICSSYIALYPCTSSKCFTYYYPWHTCAHLRTPNLLNSSI